MKANRYLLIAISILLSIYACKDRSYPNALTLADSLASSKPSFISVHTGTASIFVAYSNSQEDSMHYQYGYSISSGSNITDTGNIHHSSCYLYKYQASKKDNVQSAPENRDKTLRICLIAGGLVIALLLFIACKRYCKWKKMELKERLGQPQTIEKENQVENEFFEKDESQKNELERENQKYLFNSDLYKQLLERISSARGKAYITPVEWELLKKLLSPAFPAFFEKLYSLHALNENEMHVCILLKLRFHPADIARLLELKPESISSIRRRLYQKVTGNNGSPEMWDKIIYSL